jgi:hypothetical protein
MKAFVEVIEPSSRVYIVRVGPETDHYGAAFDFAYVGVETDGKLEIKALNGKGGTKAHFDAGLEALIPYNFSEITYERTDHRGSRSLVPTNGANGDENMTQPDKGHFKFGTREGNPPKIMPPVPTGDPAALIVAVKADLAKITASFDAGEFVPGPHGIHIAYRDDGSEDVIFNLMRQK